MPEHETGPSNAVSVIVLAAGEGTRMRSATPKVLHPIAGRPLVEHAIRAAAGAHPEHLVVVVGHGKAAITERVSDTAIALDRPIITTVQPEQRGTGHAAAQGLSALPADLAGTVVVSYGDVPLLESQTLNALLTEHANANNAITVLTAHAPNPTGYGRILRDNNDNDLVTAIVEEADATPEQRGITETNSGVYAFDAKVLADGLQRLSSNNAKNELYLTDVVGIASCDGLRVGALLCTDRWQVEGVNDRVQLAAIGAEFNRRLTQRWMRAGVTMTDPATTWLDVDVELAPDVVLEPGVQLRGRTTVGTGSVIGPDTTLINVTVGADARIVRAHCTEAEIGAGVTVGPFAYLRAGTKLAADAKIGTFVEVKKSEIGKGTKVPHLTYVGDATIGEHSNIGASSVFVNYDGVHKHRTVVGSHVRMGSDNTYVAPITIGDGAYSGAGAVLREDVPPGALAVSAGQQRNIEDWVARRRAGTPAAEAAQRAISNQTARDQEEQQQ